MSARHGPSAEVLAKARRYVRRGAVEEVGPSLYRVQGSRPGRPYIVNVDAHRTADGLHAAWTFATCSCPHGQNNALAQCSHVLAAVTYALRETD